MDCAQLTSMPVGQPVLTPYGHHGVVAEVRADVVAVYRPGLGFHVPYDRDELTLDAGARRAR